jgi:hypothetical protein
MEGMTAGNVGATTALVHRTPLILPYSGGHLDVGVPYG